MLCSRHIHDVMPQDYTKYYKMLKESSIKKLNEFKNITKLGSYKTTSYKKLTIFLILKIEEQFNILNKFKIQIDDNLKSVGMFNLKKNRNRQSIPSNKNKISILFI